jgi:hypothetical protein
LYTYPHVAPWPDSATFTSSGDKIVLSGNGSKIFDVSRFFKLKVFLTSQLTHKQALLLLGIYETIVCRALVKRSAERSFNDARNVLVPEHVKFDFNRYPSMKEAYDTLPQEIQTIVRPYLVEIPPSRVPQNDSSDKTYK